MNGECPICYKFDSDLTNNLITKCKHVFCRKCIYSHLNNKTNCPICRSELDIKKDLKILTYTGPILEKIEINKKIYYVEYKEEGKIYDLDSKIVGEIKNEKYFFY